MVDTFKEIVGIISSLVTLEEGGRSWIKEIAHLRDNKEFDLSKYRSENENVERNIDHLIQYLESSNRIDIYGADEIKEIEEGVFISISQGYYEKKELHEIIVRLFNEINSYINNHLTIGEQVVIKQLNKVNSNIEDLRENIKDKKNSTVDRSRFITDIAPNPSSKFNYRETEINDIEHMQKKNIAICGIGGIGKTSILRYMYHYYLDQTQYYLGWIPYSGDIRKDMIYHCLLYKGIEDVEEREILLRNYLREHNKQVYLFIDDVTEEVLNDDFFQFLCYTVNVIITTRYWPEDECFSKYEINAICPEDAVHLFWDYYGKKLEEPKVDEKVEVLMQEINYHPLMIEMVAKAAQFAEEPLIEFIEKVNKIGYGYSEDEIRTAHDINEETIADHLINLYRLETNCEARNRILYNFAIMKDNILPFEFRKWISDEKQNEENKKNIKWLKERGWIKKEEYGYSMHPIIKQSIMLQKEIDIEDISGLIKRISKDDFFDVNLHSDEINKRINVAESVLEYFDPFQGKNEIALEIMEGFVFACSNQSRFDEGICFANKQYEWSVKKFGNMYNDYSAEALYNLSRILCEARRFDEARECCEALYSIGNKIYDKNDIRLFYIREVLIQVCIEQRDYDRAEAEYLYADHMENPKITEIKKMKNDMAFCGLLINKYDDAIMRFDMPSEQADTLYLAEAEKILVRIYPLCEKEYADNPLELLIWYQNMANIYAYRGDSYRAANYDRKIVEVREEKLGEKNGKLAEAYLNLADDLFNIAIREKKNAKDALDYISKAYEIIVEVYGDSKIKREAEKLMSMIVCYQKENHFEDIVL